MIEESVAAYQQKRLGTKGGIRMMSEETLRFSIYGPADFLGFYILYIIVPQEQDCKKEDNAQEGKEHTSRY